MVCRVIPPRVVVALAWLAAAACYRDVEYSNCLVDDKGCPEHYVCTQNDKGKGICVKDVGRLDGGPDRALSSVDGDAGSGGSTAGDAGGADGSISSSGLSEGSSCTSNGQCASTHCTDGVCCASACTGCNACSTALTGKEDGVCAPVLTGQDPHDACADETATRQCGNDGTCDGKGACRKVGAGHICTKASCSSDGKTYTPATTCDGNGACTTATPQSCNGAQCSESGCLKACAAQADCVEGSYCDTAKAMCAAQKPNGQSATNGYECASGIVADGVCCDRSCGTCNSCTSGTCKPIANGTACGTGKVCSNGLCGACSEGAACTPTTADECHTYAYSCSTGVPVCQVSGNQPNTTPCGPPQSCTGGKQSNQSRCSNGTCPAPSTVTCSSTGCNAAGSACNTACDTATQTACGTTCCTNATQYCSGGVCKAKSIDGAACTEAGQCTSARCSNGVCCASGTGCSGTCCSGAAPYCSTSGACVQCTQDGQCGGGTPKCSPAGKCVECTGDADCSGGKTCTDNKCSCPLGGPTSACGTCLSWDFSSGMQGWEVLDPTSTKYVTAENGRLVLHHSEYSSYSGAAVEVRLCGGDSIAGVNGYSFSARVHLLYQMTPGLEPPNYIRAYGNKGKPFSIATLEDPAGYTWYTLEGVITGDSSTIGITFEFEEVFSGTVLIDDIKLTPP